MGVERTKEKEKERVGKKEGCKNKREKRERLKKIITRKYIWLWRKIKREKIEQKHNKKEKERSD